MCDWREACGSLDEGVFNDFGYGMIFTVEFYDDEYAGATVVLKLI